MEKKSADFSALEANRLAQSPAGKELASLLQQADGDSLRQAMDLAAAGNYAQAMKTLQPMMNSPQVQALLQQLRDS